MMRLITLAICFYVCCARETEQRHKYTQGNALWMISTVRNDVSPDCASLFSSILIPVRKSFEKKVKLFSF